MNDPDRNDFKTVAESLLHSLTSNDKAYFREGQLEAISELVEKGSRVLLVQRTGYGKSAVYFIATKLLREQRKSCSILISPLLALMRNQISAAEKMGLKVATINSTNSEEWDETYRLLDNDEVDLLLVSPERLGNPEFTSRISSVLKRSGLLIIDEAHCISDWGHDFRPDYRRISDLIKLLPSGVPVLACTATATDEVVEDVKSQLSHSDVKVFRGPLKREGLKLFVKELRTREERVEWLIHFLNETDGTGIVYCLTVEDAETLAGTLQKFGLPAKSYTGQLDDEERLLIEKELLKNEVKVVCATSALGMGYDKLDLKFVVHFQSPSSAIAYYQQVGRAGRGLENSYGVLLSGEEDKEIQDFFIDSAFPEASMSSEIIDAMQEDMDWWPISKIEAKFNYRRKKIVQLMKILSVEGAITNEGAPDKKVYCWRRTLTNWVFDNDRVDKVTQRRRTEQKQMLEYIHTSECRMQFLIDSLDGDDEGLCELCDNCSGDLLDYARSEDFRNDIINYQKSENARTIKPRQIGVEKGKRLSDGRVLCRWHDGGYGPLVREGKKTGVFSDELKVASAKLIKDWLPDLERFWVTAVPSRKSPETMKGFAQDLAKKLELPFCDAVIKVRETPQQKTMANSTLQKQNVQGAFELDGHIPTGPVILVDDCVDSRWTLTEIGGLLLEAGVSEVRPFALANTGGS